MFATIQGEMQTVTTECKEKTKYYIKGGNTIWKCVMTEHW